MFPSLPHTFRAHGLAADVKSLLLLRKAMERGLIHTLGDLFLVLKGILTNDPKDFGPYSTAFYDFFLNIEIKKGERLDAAIFRSDTFKNWKEALLAEEKWEEEPVPSELIDQFLDAVHMTSLDIQKILSGADILKNDDPDMADTNPQLNPNVADTLDKAADFREVSLEELMERMKRVARQQQGLHTGGSHWIGSGGTSPYGNNGAAMGGIRAGGGGGSKMARAVIGNPQFYPVDTKVPLSDNNIDIALASLKGIEEESAEQLLDIPTTITEGLKQGGIFLPYEMEKITQKVQVILLIDNGGFSMSPYIKTVTKLFSKMKTRFAHDLKTYYYHNTMYGGAYSDVRRRKFVPVEKIASQDKNYSVFIIGDADMAPYELGPRSLESWEKLKERFPRIVWLNPMSERYWASSDTLPLLKRIIPMEPLTPEGIENAVLLMNKKRQYVKR